MSELFKAFFISLMNPIRMLDHYLNNIPLPGEEGQNLKLKLSESILCAWSFHIGNALISIFFYYLMSSSIADNFVEIMEFSDGVIPKEYMTPHFFFVVSIAQDMILFPLFAYLSIKFSTLFIRFYAFVLGDSLKDSEIESVFNIALSSHVISIVPIIGISIQKLIYTFYLFLGLRKLFKGSNFIALMVIISPYILIFFFFGILISLVATAII